MNPMLLAYMQQIQNTQQPHQPSPGMAHPQGSPPPQPQQGSAVSSAMPSFINPFDAGTMSAIKAAKTSLGMDEDEKRKAMGLAMIHFGQKMGDPTIGQGSGLNGALGAISQSILPAVQAYQGEEKRVQEMNAALAEYLHKMALQQQLLRYENLKEKDALEHRDKVFKETERHNKATEKSKDYMTPYQQAMLELRRKEVGDKEVPAMTKEGHDLSEYSPLDGKKAFNDMRTIKTNSGATLRELDHINKLMDEFTKLTKDNKTDPFSPYAGKITNSIKDLAAYYGDSKKGDVQKLQKERDLRRRLFSAIEYFNVKTEQKAKGGNLGKGMVEYFEKKKILPNTDEGKDVLLGKLRDLRQEINNRHEGAKLSLKYKRHIDPSEVPNFMEMTSGAKKEAPTMEAPVEAPVEAPTANSPAAYTVRVRRPDNVIVLMTPEKAKEATNHGGEIL